MTRSETAFATMCVAYVAIIAIAQFAELRSDFAMRGIASLFPGLFA